MFVTEKIIDLKNQLQLLKEKSKTIGFVPTMGALHQGHLSLLQYSKENADITVVSIFVNPSQFNDPADFEKYPREIDGDIKKLKENNCDIIFIPSKKEIYPKPDVRIFDLQPLDKIMEGRFRPGHFQGVAKVVTKLFNIVEPDYAFFGEKDFQQLAVIKKITNDFNYKIKIISCPTIREKNGLAMSSRNTRLSQEGRKTAAQIYQTLQKARQLSKELSIDEVKNWVIKQFSLPLKLEYFEVVNEQNLSSIENWNDAKEVIGCIAVWIEGIRLIDNVKFNS